MNTPRVAINGFGRIGRAFVRRSQGRGIDIVAINDLGSLENLAYLLEYDSVYRRAPFSVELKEGALVVGGNPIKFFSEKDPTALPWKDLNIDIVVESTGIFDDYTKASAHLTAGAKRVVITAPVKMDAPNGATVLMGVNEEKLKTCQISANGSCTTNSSSPLIAILDEAIGIEKAVLSTTHAYTSTQSLSDGPVKGTDFRHGRAAAQNIVPEFTGASVSITKAYPALEGLFDGISLRVPVAVGSIADVTFISKRPTTKEEVNDILRKAAGEERWAGIFKTTDEQLVSSDIVGEPFASIAQLDMTRVVSGNLVKVLAWYDNEMGYTESLVRHVIAAGNV
jgi:glyceraldehyde 3-phosphate dehydrogenase